jgi:hypothetical protein
VFGGLIGATISAVVAITLFIIKQWMDRKRPQRIICREIGRESLVRIRRKAEHKIDVKFDGKPVERLAQLEVEIFNAGASVIKDIRMTIELG